MAKGIYRDCAARRRRIGGSRCKSVKVVDPPFGKRCSACTPVRLGRRQVAYIVADAHLLALEAPNAVAARYRGRRSSQ